ncbi:MAG: hypothetical protein ISS69_10965 [Phycisphaerae bacterium]|nr:hypothetical protein [Planctomycetota bacterium]MBL7220625.1 hypothetical protein [Phycisphaerae bacterium]
MMMEDWSMGVLKSCLLDLLRELEDKNFPLILCGGFGLYLKQLDLQERGDNYHPLLPNEQWPRPRTTSDLDILIRTEILVDTERFKLLRGILDNLGYKPIPGAEYMQFVRRLNNGNDVKADLLTGPVATTLVNKLNIGDRRIRPAEQSVGLHAYRTDEAVGFQENMQTIQIEGYCTDQRPYRNSISVPQAVTFLMMKLFAFRDRNQDPDKDFARHHAMDIYRVVAMLDHDEFRQTRSAICDYWDRDVVQEAGKLVNEHFSESTALGLIRLREHDLFDSEMDVQEFSRALADLFAKP